ncbi:MarR family winged helix-turn-helix transcriptional regulator [Paenactinomyces guangxiensis]|uniref:MarR family transcriptional regulator n=1 Tax=Paenactinomyces guangxiensis TaxID=1490290 RepID=A0A7W2A9F3_9BACL|nr:MarR family transcriptional regulator [Paenactinomyces guangxiensis]MBA4496546.1 MarR family transcriptional regulator [Paenactinomyces guangxiensis]MBH8593675.1 MarR family transcriptional regulator [Paenactinomyces guangxiensis]
MAHWDFSNSALPVQLFLSLYKTNIIMVRQLEEKLQPWGLTLGRLCLLVSLRRFNKPMLPSELGDDLAVTRANVSGLLKALEAQGMVRREFDPADRRRILVHMTPAGEKTLEQVWPVYVEAISARFKRLSPEKQALLFQLLEELDGGKE